jgi:hypothetical protein
MAQQVITLSRQLAKREAFIKQQKQHFILNLRKSKEICQDIENARIRQQ